MAPNITSAPTGVLSENEEVKTHQLVNGGHSKEPKEYKLQIVWRNVAIFAFLHVAALYGLYLAVISAKLATTIFGNLNFFIYFDFFFQQFSLFIHLIKS